MADKKPPRGFGQSRYEKTGMRNKPYPKSTRQKVENNKYVKGYVSTMKKTLIPGKAIVDGAKRLNKEFDFNTFLTGTSANNIKKRQMKIKEGSAGGRSSGSRARKNVNKRVK
jgi:hypothetical protein